uniref:Enoyl reductase (ER) domain-containing protein n=1 Tax=Chenopodium quinoa TaxID=63459 RepID=A0A803L665_CHEQI
MEVVQSKEWHMAAYARDGLPSSDHLKLRTVSLSLAVDSIPENHVAIQSLWISVDPYLRSRMTGVEEDGLNVSQYPINQVIVSYGVGKIIRSKDAKYKEGDLVVCSEMPVAEYSVIPSQAVTTKIDPALGVSPSEYLNVLGIPGLAAWVGIQVIGKPKAGENVFISAAAGGVGMIAGQLAKIKGCRVIGSTGSDDKVRLLKEEFGFDDAFNYKKETDLDAALSKYFPNGIDIYFENVGGRTLEAVLNHVNTYARIPLCGMISQYNKGTKEKLFLGRKRKYIKETKKAKKNPRPTKEQKKKTDFKQPNLPSELIEKVKGLTDEVPKLVMQKYITVTDVSEHHKRLLISKTDMRKVNGCMLLNDQEKRELDQGRDIKVIVIWETKEEVNLSLSKWPKKNSELDESTRNYVLQSDWIEVTNKIDPKEDDVGQLWTFRFGQDKREPGRPASDTGDFQKWVRNDYMVQSWLLNAMEKMIFEGFILQQSALL